MPPASTSNSPLCIEVCVDSVRSALNAVKGGADRLEVCENLGVGGGTTPSLGLLKAIQRSVDVPLMVMVRPRTGDFLYSEDEIEVMLEDIRVFKEHNVCGVVLGVLKADGRVDVEVTKRLVDEALPLQGEPHPLSFLESIFIMNNTVCFHRAFDMTRDPEEGMVIPRDIVFASSLISVALADVMNIGGVSRILTSGHGPTALESLDTLESLCDKTQKLAEELPWVLNILPGSGINSDTVGPILDALLPRGLMELHLSGGSWEEGGMVHRRHGLGMGVGETEWSVWMTSEEKVRSVRRFADAVWAEYARNEEI
ncbi:Copper homeostasis protein cutC like protein [Mycena venus]|uniref:Copper homeostasis protein cutC homolog n=1 Tax=Mycena venus TaxID=2733690 RepID=A0A8H7CTD7_9AGAR|nr:Copper homeostasis protein cutC like protein [Mycena venus]